MSFDIAKLALHHIALNAKYYEYSSTDDSLATIMASGYFGQDSTTGQQAAAMLDAGDVIAASGSDGLLILRIDTVSGNTVTVEMGLGQSVWISYQIEALQTQAACYIPVPLDGFVRRTKLVTNGDIDETTVVTFHHTALSEGEANTDNLITGATITVDQSGVGAGEVYESLGTANNAVQEGDGIRIQWDGAPTDEPAATLTDAVVLVEIVPG